MNEGPNNGRWKGGLEPYTARATQLLRDAPMTRYELQCALGTSQQLASKVLRAIGAKVVSHQQPPKQGTPTPVYGLEDDKGLRWNLGRASSVWQLGAQA